MYDKTTAEEDLPGGRHYTARELFENWDESFSLYELYVHEDGREDLKIIDANRTFAELIMPIMTRCPEDCSRMPVPRRWTGFRFTFRLPRQEKEIYMNPTIRI